MKILITGINGFVGTILENALKQKGHDIYGIDLQAKGDKRLSVDITDFSSVSECVNDIKPDFIFHLAAISRVDMNNPSLIFNINVNGTIHLLSAASRLEKMSKFLLISSSQVYGNVNPSIQPITESAPVNPVNFYGASKASAENALTAFRNETGIEAAIARPFNHTGRGQTQNFVIPKIVEAFKKDIKEIELGNTHTVRDFLDVRDVIKAYITIMDNFRDGKIFNIASGRGISIDSTIRELEKISGKKIKILKGENLVRKNEIESSIGDYNKIKKELNWEPEINFTETLKWMLS